MSSPAPTPKRTWADAMIEHFDEELAESRAEIARLERILESLD